MKHIESIQPEYAAFELDRIGREETDATASAALSRLLHNVTGCAIPPTADTPQSEVEELVPLCLSILRRHWTTPLTALGDGTTPMSLADLLRRLIGDRVQGNEALSIPAIHANIPTAVAALRQRDMSSGLTLTLTDGTDGSTDGSTTTSPTTTSLPDGLSLAQLLCSGLADNITELHDDNIGWTMTKALPTFPNLKKLYLGCGSVIGRFSIVSNTTTEEVTILAKHVEAGSGTYPPSFFTGSALKKINAPYMETFYIPGNDAGFVKNCENLEEINAPMLRNIISGYANTAFLCLNQSQLRRLVLGTITGSQAIMCGSSGAGIRPKLIHLELGAGTNVSLSSLKYWNPSYVLSDNPTGTDLIEEGSTAANNLEQFLQNFRDYIANRLTDKGGGLTLTLSQAVRDAIQQDPDIVNIITSKGWTISPAPSV